eukprot:191162_1
MADSDVSNSDDANHIKDDFNGFSHRRRETKLKSNWTCFLSILFMFPTVLLSEASKSMIIMYMSMVYGIFGCFFNLRRATMVNVVYYYADKNETNKILGYINLSWCVVSGLYIPIGYILQYSHYSVICLISGISSIIYGVTMHFFVFGNLKHETVTNSNESNHNIIDILNNKFMIITICLGFVQGISIDIFESVLCSPWLEDIYHLSTVQVGYVMVILVFAEILGTLFASQWSAKIGEVICIFSSYFIWLICGLTIYSLTELIGDDMGGLMVPFIIIFCLFFCDELVNIVTVIFIANNAPKQFSKQTTILYFHTFVAIGNIVGVEIATHIWNKGKENEVLGSSEWNDDRSDRELLS